ncbi:CotH kinase family protein [Saccharicrinis sp. FJH54]|uniref:CotH kinase family protein n=1 Tax=Saccharicrinis sp. FJH54 TaxID=3344665 RepID=UPI0035D4A7A0
MGTKSFNANTLLAMRSIFLIFALILVVSVHSQQQVSNLTTLIIDTDGAAINSTDTYIPGTLYVLSTDPDIKNDTLPMKIRGRGNSTWGMPKKPFRIKLDDDKHLLGMKAKNRDWVLLANYADKSLIRNALAFKIGEWVNLEFNPDFRFVDVILNGNYVGNYMLTDQVEVAKNRVPVEKQDTSVVSLPDLSGGYLLEVDGFADREPVWFQTTRGVKTTVKYPDDDDINTEQLDYIKTYIQQYEDVLFSETYKDPETGYRAYNDSATLVNWYIASELTGNPDCFWSTNIYKKRSNDKLFWGPMWDYDIAFNNDSRQEDAQYKLMRESAYNPRVWINRLWQDDWFVRAVGKRWENLVETGISDSVQNYINDAANLIDQSQVKNFERWDILPDKVYLEQFLFDTWEENIDFLRDYMTERISFLNDNLAQYVEPFVIENYYYAIRNNRSDLVIDISEEDSNVLNMWEYTDDLLSQQWEIVDLGDGTVRFENRFSGMAIKGMGKGNSVVLSEISETNDSLRWTLEPLGPVNLFGLINVGTGNAIDNSGGGTSNGTKCIEWDNQVASNQNQQWVFEKIESIPSGLVRNTLHLNLSVYPNPVENKLFIASDKGLPENLSYLIVDLSGKEVLSATLSGSSIDLSQLGSGIYFVKLFTENSSEVFRIIRQ